MHSDKPTLWIMFLSLGALITPFLVQNPSHLCRRGGERNARRAKASRRAHASAIIAPQGGKGRAAKTARGDQKRKKKRPFLENTPRPGSACQNTSPSPNWVVLDTPIPRPPPPPTPLHPPRGASVLMGGGVGWGVARSLRGLAGTESKPTPTLPADNLAEPERENIRTRGPSAPASTAGA